MKNVATLQDELKYLRENGFDAVIKLKYDWTPDDIDEVLESEIESRKKDLACIRKIIIFLKQHNEEINYKNMYICEPRELPKECIYIGYHTAPKLFFGLPDIYFRLIYKHDNKYYIVDSCDYPFSTGPASSRCC